MHKQFGVIKHEIDHQTALKEGPMFFQDTDILLKFEIHFSRVLQNHEYEGSHVSRRTPVFFLCVFVRAMVCEIVILHSHSVLVLCSVCVDVTICAEVRQWRRAGWLLHGRRAPTSAPTSLLRVQATQ